MMKRNKRLIDLFELIELGQGMSWFSFVMQQK
jgi:hypothetical protein